jgi:hypothetical protein
MNQYVIWVGVTPLLTSKIVVSSRKLLDFCFPEGLFHNKIDIELKINIMSNWLALKTNIICGKFLLLNSIKWIDK